MLSIETLRQYGADVDDGLKRCVNNEEFYLKLVKMFLADEKNDFLKLDEALEKRDLKAAFEAAHTIKGTSANLALTPMYEVIAIVSDKLKAGEDIDYSNYMNTVHEQKAVLDRLNAD